MLHDEEPNDKLRDAALEYAGRGIPVFPVKADKAPYTAHAFYDATTDTEQIEEWWQRWPGAGIAVPTGADTGLVVLDADRPEALERLEALGMDATAPKVKTARDTHYYYQHPGVKVKSRPIFDGCDVKADGGYVLVPPSPAKEWVVPLNGHLPELPPWFDRVNVRVDDPKEPFDTAAALEGAPKGARDNTLIGLVGKLVAAGVPRWATERLALEYAASCDEPFSQSKALNKVARAYEHWEPNLKLLDKAQGITAALERPPLEAVLFKDVPRPGPQRWMVDELVPEGHSTTMYGSGGSTKSLLALDLAMCVADPDTDRWRGRLIQTAPVLYVDFELDQETQARRVYRLLDGSKRDAMPEQLAYLSTAGYSTDEAVRAALDAVEAHKAKLVVIDSVGLALVGAAEESKDALAFYRAVVSPLLGVGVTVLLVDHTSKDPRDKSIFGSVYKTNTTRSAILVESEKVSRSERLVTLTPTKANLGPEEDPLRVAVVFEGTDGPIRISDRPLTPKERVEAAPTLEEKVRRVFEADMRPLTVPDVAEVLNEGEGADKTSVDTVRAVVGKLKGAGRVENTGEKRGKAPLLRLTTPAC